MCRKLIFCFIIILIKISQGRFIKKIYKTYFIKDDKSH